MRLGRGCAPSFASCLSFACAPINWNRGRRAVWLMWKRSSEYWGPGPPVNGRPLGTPGVREQGHTAPFEGRGGRERGWLVGRLALPRASCVCNHTSHFGRSVRGDDVSGRGGPNRPYRRRALIAAPGSGVCAWTGRGIRFRRRRERRRRGARQLQGGDILLALNVGHTCPPPWAVWEKVLWLCGIGRDRNGGSRRGVGET